MKRLTALALLATLSCAAAPREEEAPVTQAEPPRGESQAAESAPMPRNPITGMTLAQIEDALSGIKAQIPEAATIIKMYIENENTILVETGRIYGVLNGRGRSFYFEKVDGVWTKTNEFHWGL